MARVLENLKMFAPGNPEESEPSEVLVTYSVVDGSARKDNCSHNVSEPDFSKTASTFWGDEIIAIKTAEGIS